VNLNPESTSGAFTSDAPAVQTSETIGQYNAHVTYFCLLHSGFITSLCAAVTICATVVNIQTGHTDRQHFDQLIRTAQPAELNIFRDTKLNICF